MALSATLVAPVAWLAISPIELPICSDAAATVEMFVDTRSAAADAVLDWAEVSSAAAPTCWATAERLSDEPASDRAFDPMARTASARSEERRVGKAGVRAGSSRRSPDQSKNKRQ